MRYMYSLYFTTIDGRYRCATTPRLSDIRKWLRTPEAASASGTEIRRIPLTYYNEAGRVHRGEFGGWDFRTLRISSELFDVTMAVSK